MPRDLRHEGRVVAAERTADGALAYCVRKGFGEGSLTRCLRVDPSTRSIAGHEELWPGFRLGEIAPPESPAGATYASAAGTLTVCARPGDCWERRFRPPAKDAWDEVYGGVPAYTVPGTRRVLVADVTEDRKPATLWIHAYDLGKRARVAQSRVVREEYGLSLSALGARVLLVTSEREGSSSHAYVVDPSSLAVTPLGVELDPALRGGMFAPAPASLVLDDGRGLVADARGRALLVFDGAGKQIRRVTLSHPGDLGFGPSRVAPLGRGRVAVIQSAPNAGIVEWVSLDDGTVLASIPVDCAPAAPE